MQLTFNSGKTAELPACQLISLHNLNPGQRAILEELRLPETVGRRLMELGFLPGQPVSAGHAAPGGDPRVFRVDGTEIALRRETAEHILVRLLDSTDSTH